MLTDKQKDNLGGLLYLMTPEDLKSLANTVTNYLITPVDYEEAVTTILQYTENMMSLMNRKKITKELVFRYLHQNQVDGVSPTQDKRTMIELLLSHWGENEQTAKPESTSSQKFQAVLEPVTPASSAPPPLSPSSPSQTGMNEMAENFAKWFYTLVNQGVSEGGQIFGPEHFWPDCHLAISLKNSWLQIKEERSNGSEAALLLQQLQSQFNLLFNPNLSPEGTRGMSEPHGAVIVISCGTVHRADICAGVFEQKFLLLRDPNMQNNWRIKRSEMCLQAGAGSALPQAQSTSKLMINQ